MRLKYNTQWHRQVNLAVLGPWVPAKVGALCPRSMNCRNGFWRRGCKAATSPRLRFGRNRRADSDNTSLTAIRTAHELPQDARTRVVVLPNGAGPACRVASGQGSD